MKIAGIVAEYNPFHSGHAHHIQRTRDPDGGCRATHIAVVMSGSFVQRGEPALLPKAERVRMALAGGADLVLELPLPWSMASAEGFAFGAVAILDALGCVDAISFGSECGDAAALQKAAALLESPRFGQLLRYRLEDGISFPEARQKAVADIAGQKTAALFSRPNNTLGIEYLKALTRLGSAMHPFTIPRFGAEHDEMQPLGDVASASYIRRLAAAGRLLNAAPFLPPACYAILSEASQTGRCPAAVSRLERGLLARFREMAPADWRQVPGVSEGLENRLTEAARQAGGWEDLLERIKTRRYPLTRLQRLLWAAFLGIPAGLEKERPPYARILGLNAKGEEILAAVKEIALPGAIPLVSRPGRIDTLGEAAKQVWQLENRAADLYALTLPQPYPCGTEYTTGVIRME